jgi:hypothetical protein
MLYAYAKVVYIQRSLQITQEYTSISPKSSRRCALPRRGPGPALAARVQSAAPAWAAATAAGQTGPSPPSPERRAAGQAPVAAAQRRQNTAESHHCVLHVVYIVGVVFCDAPSPKCDQASSD